MTPAQFIAKWKKVTLTERSASQSHFNDLCAVLDEMNPVQADPTGEFYTFEKGVTKDSGGKGWADVWKKDCFGWEYKGKHKDLAEALRQLQRYREALLDPPLLIVCDMDRFQVHTNFNNSIKVTYEFNLEGLADPKNLDILRKAFRDPYALDPKLTQPDVTKEVAGKLTEVADELRHNLSPTQKANPEDANQRIAHFLMKCIFCMFAEDADLLPKNLFTNLLQAHNKKRNAEERQKLEKVMASLFRAMAVKESTFGNDAIRWFNGSLFDDDATMPLGGKEIRLLLDAAEQDWSNVDASIFGTLFERLLIVEKRSQTGAHYTSREDIETLLNPVMLDPLKREWEESKVKAEKAWDAAKGNQKSKAYAEFEALIDAFLKRLHAVSVLDPACGSGNFLYVALKMLLDLEKAVLTFATTRDGKVRNPGIRPTQLHGIEINTYAAELAQIVIWIGLLQWQKENGYPSKKDPVLEKVTTIENRDAILDLSDPANPKEPTWPDAEFIVGNPPFLGDKKMRGEMGDEYVQALRKHYEGRLPGQTDLVTYWFEKSRSMIEANAVKRAGLIATQGIRGGGNRKCLERIKETADIFMAHRVCSF